MPPVLKLFWQLAGNPKPQKKPKKKPCLENKLEYDSFIKVEILDKNLMRTKTSHN